MNTSNVTTGAYIGSDMYTTNLEAYRTTITTDFGSSHILSHKEYFSNAVTSEYESAGAWYDSTVDLMSEIMVYGCNIFHNVMNGTNRPNNVTIDKRQLSLFRLDQSKIIALNNNGTRQGYWLRDVASSSNFTVVSAIGICTYSGASITPGIRPAFLIY